MTKILIIISAYFSGLMLLATIPTVILGNFWAGALIFSSSGLSALVAIYLISIEHGEDK